MLQKKFGLGKLLGKSKWVALLGVFVLNPSAVALVITGIVMLYDIISDICYQIINSESIDTIKLSAKFLLIIEIY